VAGAPVGPVPAGTDADDYDRRRRRTLWRMPSGLYLLGTAHDGRRNLMTHNWAMQVSVAPKLLGVAVRGDSLTHELLLGGGAFSLNFVRREDRAVVRAFTKPAVEGPEPGLLSGLPVVEGVTGVPVVAGAPAYLECELRASLATGDHTLFVGEVVACQAADEAAEVLRMEDTRLSYGG
jgi:flavin reductase (DIM6/NTAB) family NADH-FMN oxidoreductase RutF